MSTETLNKENQKVEEKLQPGVLVVVEEKPVEVEVITDELTQKADSVIKDVVLAYDEFKSPAAVITTIGTQELNELKQLSQVLDTPIKNIMGNEQSPQDQIGKSLIEIKVQADKITPDKFNLNPGFFGRIIGFITGNNALNAYTTKFTSTKDIIQSISKSLDNSILRLKEDNAIFEQDKTRYRKAAVSLKEKIQLLIAVDSVIESKITEEQDIDKKQFLQEEVLFTARSHTQDLQQTYIATQQGIAALNLLIKNNVELIRGVERTQRAVIPIMSIGFTIATGLAKQKEILDLTDSINQTASDTMVKNSEMLQKQGAQIQKQAINSSLDLDKLTQSMTYLIQAIDDVETFKVNALPGMKESIARLNDLTNKVDTKLVKFEKGEEFRKEQAKQIANENK